MDNNNGFQTSFIPKKPLVEEKAPRSHKVSLFNFLATLVFFASLAAAGGMYFYKSTLESGIEKKQADLERAQAAFDPGTIQELITLDRRINTSMELLDKHMIISPIFDLLSDSTLTTVQFTDFKFETPDATSDEIKVELIGVAPGYKTIGLEEEAFAKNQYIKNPVFSNLTLGTKGQVTFNVTFTVDPALLEYTGAASEIDTTFTTATTTVDSSTSVDTQPADTITP